MKLLSGYKLLELKVKNNEFLRELNIIFTNDSKNFLPYTSIIIGPNGTGKSYILRTIVDLYRELKSIKSKGKRGNYVSGEFYIKYSIGSHIYEFTNIRNESLNSNEKFYFLENGKLVQNYEKIILPNKIIASSIMLTDKFPFIENFDEYEYLGIRRSRSDAGTRTLIKRTVSCLVESLASNTFQINLKEVLGFLNLEKKFTLKYETRFKEVFFTGNLTYSIFKDFFENYNKKRETVPRRFTNYTKIKKEKDKIDKIIKFCNNSFRKNPKNDDNTKAIYLEYDLIKDNSIVKDYEIIQELADLDLVSFPQITIQKEKCPYDLEHSSSGEFQLLTTLVGIYAKIKNNSLVLIDEPEISLHPNWQMKYIDNLNKIFKGFANSHFIIATHSHFIISDLKINDSCIVRLERNEGMIFSDTLNNSIDTYAWSAEEILYNIFKLKTTRNFYLESDLTELLGLMSINSNETNKIQSKLKKLEMLNLSDQDPLNEVIKEAKEYLNDRKNK